MLAVVERREARIGPSRVATSSRLRRAGRRVGARRRRRARSRRAQTARPRRCPTNSWWPRLVEGDRAGARQRPAGRELARRQVVAGQLRAGRHPDPVAGPGRARERVLAARLDRGVADGHAEVARRLRRRGPRTATIPPAIAYLARCGMGPLVDVVRDAVAPVLEELGRRARVVDLVEVHARRLARAGTCAGDSAATTSTIRSHRSSRSRRPPPSRASSRGSVGPDRRLVDPGLAATRWARLGPGSSRSNQAGTRRPARSRGRQPRPAAAPRARRRRRRPATAPAADERRERPGAPGRASTRLVPGVRLGRPSLELGRRARAARPGRSWSERPQEDRRVHARRSSVTPTWERIAAADPQPVRDARVVGVDRGEDRRTCSGTSRSTATT